MTAPEAKVILDSISPEGVRLTTLEVTFHRFVLAEFNTHRMLSRNSASSRAIPVEKQLKKVKDNPAWPLRWPVEQPGMQGGTDLEDLDLLEARTLFESVYSFTVSTIEGYIQSLNDEYGDEAKKHRLHKSLINRLLEPFMWHTVIVTATSWEGFWNQRCSPLAQPEIEAPAREMLAAYSASTPVPLDYGEWHTPYILEEEYDILDSESRKQISSARCARVSYLTHDGIRNWNEDYRLFNRLTEETPPHASPLEHVATPASPQEATIGNFDGWHQLRHMYWV